MPTKREQAISELDEIASQQDTDGYSVCRRLIAEETIAVLGDEVGENMTPAEAVQYAKTSIYGGLLYEFCGEAEASIIQSLGDLA